MKKITHLALPYQLRADMLSQLAALSHASIAPLQALPMIKLPGKDQARVDGAVAGLKRGKNLADAGLQSGLWTPLEAGLLQAALAAGDPTSTLRHLASHYQEKARQIASVKSGMFKPGLMVLVSLFVTPLPQLVAGSLSTAGYIWHIVRALAILGGLIFGGIHAYRSYQMRPANAPVSAMDKLLLDLPMLGDMHKRRNLCDFWQSMALMLAAGLPMFEALPLAQQAASNVLIRRQLARILPQMQQGSSLDQAVASIPTIHDDTLSGLIKTGDASGQLPAMLERYARTENASLALRQQQVSEWIPRIVYAIVAAVIAYGIIVSGAFNPHVGGE